VRFCAIFESLGTFRRESVSSIVDQPALRPLRGSVEEFDILGNTLAARGESRSEPFGANSARMQGRAKRRRLCVFGGDFHHGLLECHGMVLWTGSGR
jgi:hypothetical protein